MSNEYEFKIERDVNSKIEFGLASRQRSYSQS